MARSLVSGQIKITTLLSFIFGITFVIVILLFAVIFPNPTPSQFNVFIVVLALAAAGIGANLPGSLQVNHQGWLKAGGSLGLFVIVLFARPLIANSAVRFERPTASALPLALNFVHLNDDGSIAEAWNSIDPELRETAFTSLDFYTQMYQNFRKPLGSASNRAVQGSGGGENLPGFPVGLYQYFVFKTHFSAEPECRWETVLLRATSDRQWRIATYQVSPTEVACVRQPPIVPPTSL